ISRLLAVGSCKRSTVDPENGLGSLRSVRSPWSGHGESAGTSAVASQSTSKAPIKPQPPGEWAGEHKEAASSVKVPATVGLPTHSIGSQNSGANEILSPPSNTNSAPGSPSQTPLVSTSEQVKVTEQPTSSRWNSPPSSAQLPQTMLRSI